MIGIVVVTHSQLGQALLDAAGFVLGQPVEQAKSVSVDLKESASKLRKDIGAAIKEVSAQQGVLVLTDMFGGTPSNLAYSFLEEGRVEVISGANLPLLIRADNLRRRKNPDLKDLAQELEEYGKKSICLASGMLKGKKTAG
ncbi:MAG: PTS fructose transporter subunit IIA [Deltaproteobacteria bacterium]|nr:PTS fructose transporter subunit IIA [Deltaproteobacteria bacterium]